ncbi:ferric-chelate reductase 1 [Panulirus ornatus]|uniref:ferric-chelate reductase 1 n=1 Tax=Panulirus ornatus TaxID=150431 RepID=UPI003A8A8695
MLGSATTTCLLAVLLAALGDAFPDGAPIESCITEIPNRPNHAGTKPRNPNSSKHRFTASSYNYLPGSIIKVRISGPPFKGFFVQARDIYTNKWIGEFAESDQAMSYPECSAVTHNTVPPKTDVLLLWKAPYNRAGSVKFTGTILEKYDKYWSEMVAKVPYAPRVLNA